MTTLDLDEPDFCNRVVEAYRLDRYDNFYSSGTFPCLPRVVEAYRLDRYDNFDSVQKASWNV